MLDDHEIAAAATTLYGHWQARTKLGALDPSQRPRTRAEGYAIAAAMARHFALPPLGWKIAATSEAGQKHINVTDRSRGASLPSR
jgi:2-keto-4-pentenoate hydratase